jgi:NAD(P)-dependent dehydrogenase (short-subunit alcohol dehydrogenase family)
MACSTLLESYRVDTLTDELWDRCIAINLTKPVKLMRAVKLHMQEAGGGIIVNVASKAGLSGAVAGVAYTSSKHGNVRPSSSFIRSAADLHPKVGAMKNVAYRFR